MKRYGLGIVILVLVMLVAMPLNLTNSYLRASEFDTVTVEAADSVTSLASRYTTDEGRLRELTAAIIEVNGLKLDGSNLRAGQTVKIPVLARERNAQLAER